MLLFSKATLWSKKTSRFLHNWADLLCNRIKKAAYYAFSWHQKAYGLLNAYKTFESPKVEPGGLF